MDTRLGRLVAFVMFVVLVALHLASYQVSAAPEELLPDWVRAEWELRTQDGGNWVADNSANLGENEPYEAYGQVWSWGLGKKTLKGRLYAIQKGKEVGTLFEYRLMWHPGEKKLMVTQYGSDGTFAIGTVMPVGEGMTEVLQRFYHPDGRTHQVGHRVQIKGGEMHIQAYDVSEGGVWTQRRRYLWKRVN